MFVMQGGERLMRHPGMGEIRNQVDQAMAGAVFLDPDSPDHGKLHYTSDRDAAIEGAIGGLITAVRAIADHLDAH